MFAIGGWSAAEHLAVLRFFLERRFAFPCLIKLGQEFLDAWARPRFAAGFRRRLADRRSRRRIHLKGFAGVVSRPEFFGRL
jgi:hypothetical protein